MRKVFLSIFLFMAITVQAQTWNEWFRQKKTQIRYLQRQIAALQVYIELGQEGYGIAHDGLQLISDIKNGDFDLHNGYFNSLLEVKTSISQYKKVKEMLLVSVSVRQQIKACVRLTHADGWSTTDLYYINNVLDKFIEKVSNNAVVFNELITNGHYSLKHDERLKRIEQIYNDMNEQYAFSKYLYNSLVALQAGRRDELGNTEALRKLYDLQMP